MAGETIITVVGNLTADPELRSTKNGRSVAGFTIASTPRTFDRQSQQWVDGDALFLRWIWPSIAPVVSRRACVWSPRAGLRSIRGRTSSIRSVPPWNCRWMRSALPCGMRRRRWPRRSVVRLERMGIRTPLRPAIRAGRPLRIRCRRPTRGAPTRPRLPRRSARSDSLPNRIFRKPKDESWASR